MKNILYFLCAAAALASCSSSYNIQGTSDVQNLDGHMMYIKAIEGNELKSIDSCDVVHGKFEFRGSIDTIKVGTLFINNEGVMPVVLEEGDITIKFNTAKQTCTGTFLNDKLTDFIEQYNQITNQIADLDHQEAQAMMNGEDMNIVYRELQKKSDILRKDADSLITSFIEQNFDNVLGPFVFRMATSTEIPMTNAWIDALMIKATESFKNDRYVKEFMEEANRNQAIMTGMDDPTPAVPEAPADGKVETPPTPNEMANPQK
jgi:hypothetical protein